MRARSAITALSATQHGDVLASGDLGGSVRVWQLLHGNANGADLRLHRVWSAHSDRVASLHWAEPPSLAEIFLVSAGDDGRVALWTPNGQAAGRFGERRWALSDGLQSPPVSVRVFQPRHGDVGDVGVWVCGHVSHAGRVALQDNELDPELVPPETETESESDPEGSGSDGEVWTAHRADEALHAKPPPRAAAQTSVTGGSGKDRAPSTFLPAIHGAPSPRPVAFPATAGGIVGERGAWPDPRKCLPLSRHRLPPAASCAVSKGGDAPPATAPCPGEVWVQFAGVGAPPRDDLAGEAAQFLSVLTVARMTKTQVVGWNAFDDARLVPQHVPLAAFLKRGAGAWTRHDGLSARIGRVFRDPDRGNEPFKAATVAVADVAGKGTRSLAVRDTNLGLHRLPPLPPGDDPAPPSLAMLRTLEGSDSLCAARCWGAPAVGNASDCNRP